jgi:hypothetical protein
MAVSHIDSAEHARMLNILKTGGPSQRNPRGVTKILSRERFIQLKRNLLSILIDVALLRKNNT